MISHSYVSLPEGNHQQSSQQPHSLEAAEAVEAAAAAAAPVDGPKRATVARRGERRILAQLR